MTITAPAALESLSAPLPVPRSFTLLDAARIVPEANERWMAGAFIDSYPGGHASTFDPCSAGSARVKDIVGVFARPMFGAFTAYLAAECTAASVVSDPRRYRERLLAAFVADEATAAERVLVSGDGHSTMGPYLGDANMEVLGSGAVTPTEGLALLEDEIASVGNGMIHVAPATATYWLANTLIAKASDGQMRTGLGTLVAVGAGYRDADPDDGTSPAADQEWAFASGFVEVRRSDTFVIPDDLSEALDRSMNDVTYLVERNYLLSWVGRQDASDDDFIQAGVLIDRIS